MGQANFNSRQLLPFFAMRSFSLSKERAGTLGMDAARVKQSQKKLTERGREDVAETRHTGRAAGSVAPQIVQGVHDAPIVKALSLAATSPTEDHLSIMHQVHNMYACMLCAPACTRQACVNASYQTTTHMRVATPLRKSIVARCESLPCNIAGTVVHHVHGRVRSLQPVTLRELLTN